MNHVFFDYQLSPDQRGRVWTASEDIRDGQLRYGQWESIITFRVGGCDLSPTWEWTPILDFVDIFLLHLHMLSTREEVEFDFTESPAFIRLGRVGAVLTVSTSYSSCVATHDFGDFAHSLTMFARRVVEDLKQLDPVATESAAFKGIESRMFSYPPDVALR
jgi:hypothetical protein